MRLADANNAYRWRQYLLVLSNYISQNFNYEDYRETINSLCYRLHSVKPWPEEINNWRLKIEEETAESVTLTMNFYGVYLKFIENSPTGAMAPYETRNRQLLLKLFARRARNLVGLISIDDCPSKYKESLKSIARRYIHENCIRTWQNCEPLRAWIKTAEK